LEKRERGGNKVRGKGAMEKGRKEGKRGRGRVREWRWNT